MGNIFIQIRFSESEEKEILNRIKGKFKNRSTYHKKCFQKYTPRSMVFNLDVIEAQKMSYNVSEKLDRRFNVVYSSKEEVDRVKAMAKKYSLGTATFLRYLTLLDLKMYRKEEDKAFEEKLDDYLSKLDDGGKEKVLDFARNLYENQG